MTVAHLRGSPPTQVYPHLLTSFDMFSFFVLLKKISKCFTCLSWIFHLQWSPPTSALSWYIFWYITLTPEIISHLLIFYMISSYFTWSFHSLPNHMFKRVLPKNCVWGSLFFSDDRVNSSHWKVNKTLVMADVNLGGVSWRHLFVFLLLACLSGKVIISQFQIVYWWGWCWWCKMVYKH